MIFLFLKNLLIEAFLAWKVSGNSDQEGYPKLHKKYPIYIFKPAVVFEAGVLSTVTIIWIERQKCLN